MKYVKIAAPWVFRAYIVWSICADLFLIGLAVWYFFLLGGTDGKCQTR